MPWAVTLFDKRWNCIYPPPNVGSVLHITEHFLGSPKHTQWHVERQELEETRL